ncbi:MAG: DUF4381 domain-containing protein [Methylococcales bacterium]|jgi:hypothetical protein|nr:DUF4381 domain-containing protein [Methylococcales bacterium]MBT7409989.1 DUF4381 domain-containing protein [Methylococcales bacterium]
MTPQSPESINIHDIHMQTDVSWWPIAPGWWAVLLMIILLVLVVILFYWYRKKTQLKRLAQQQLAQLCQQYEASQDAHQLVKDMSVLLRRICLSQAPRQNSAGLCGEQWLKYLDSHLVGEPFSSGIGKLLIDMPYRATMDAQSMDEFINLCKRWINQGSISLEKPVKSTLCIPRRLSENANF